MLCVPESPGEGRAACLSRGPENSVRGTECTETETEVIKGREGSRFCASRQPGSLRFRHLLKQVAQAPRTAGPVPPPPGVPAGMGRDPPRLCGDAAASDSAPPPAPSSPESLPQRPHLGKRGPEAGCAGALVVMGKRLKNIY